MEGICLGSLSKLIGHMLVVRGKTHQATTTYLLVIFAPSDARVMWDQQTGRSRGFGFLSFRNQQDAQSAINDLTGKWVGSRQIRCNWVTKGAGTSDEKQTSDVKSVIELTDGSSEEVKETVSSSAPTVYVGNLATEIELHHQFHALGAGSIEEVRVQRDKGFGFVRYSTHAEAAMAIQLGHSESYLCGRQIKCSWGNKLTPAGTSSNLLLPPRVHGLDALAYESQGSTSGSQAIYDCGFQSSNI